MPFDDLFAMLVSVRIRNSKPEKKKRGRRKEGGSEVGVGDCPSLVLLS